MANYGVTKIGSLLSAGVITTVRILKYLKNQTVDNLTFTGRVTKGQFRTKAGGFSFSGTISSVNRRILKTGILSMAGVVTNTSGRVRRLTLTGLISLIRVQKYYSSQATNILSFLGTVSVRAGNFFGQGVLSLSGALTRRINKLTRSLAGTIALVGTATGNKFGVGYQYSKTIAGIIGFAGSIIDVLVTTIYTYTKNRTISLSGTITKRRNLKRTKDGVVSFTKYLEWAMGGFVSVHYYRTYAGAVGFAGHLRKGLFKTKAGVLSLVGTVTRKIIVTHSQAGVLGFSGSIYGWLSGTIRYWTKYPSGIISFAGSVSADFFISVLRETGALSLVGSVTKRFMTTRAKNSAMSFRGRAYGDLITDALYYGTPSP